MNLPDLEWLAELRGDRRAAADELARLRELGWQVLWGDSLEQLFPVPDPPRLLHCWGAPPGPGEIRISIVGSRRASTAGLRQAYRLGRELAEVGVRVVSGLARGVDSAALEGAAAGGLGGIAILGNGLPAIYPEEKTELARRTVETGGAILSEWPLDAPPRRHHFPRRNRLISALGAAVVVVEAALRSGSLITASWALEQGREVMAYPGPAEGPGYEGCHRLIREGALLVVNSVQVLEGLSSRPVRTDAEERAALAEALTDGGETPEELVARTGIPPAVLLQMLSSPGAPRSSSDGANAEDVVF